MSSKNPECCNDIGPEYATKNVGRKVPRSGTCVVLPKEPTLSICDHMWGGKKIGQQEIHFTYYCTTVRQIVTTISEKWEGGYVV